MTQQGDAREQYVIPRYREATAPAWYHVLHGTVPGHQIDFIYSPEVPQGQLTRTHLAHLGRIIKYIEPRDHTSLAFAIGNLSRDDVQHEPGHGGLALIFGLRVRGVIDHASRDMPPYAHGLLAIDRALDYSVLLDAISTFYRRFLHEGPGDDTGDFYRSYVQVMREQPHAVEGFLRAYIREFDDLPQPPRSTFGGDFVATEGVHPQRVTIVHAPNEPFTSIAHLAATLGSVLYRSNVKWTSISNGREIDIPGGVTVRLVPEGEVPRGAKGLVLRLDEVPADDAEIAQNLFGAHPRETGTVRRVGWREQMAAKKGGGPAGAPARDAVAEGLSAREGARETGRLRELARERTQERESARERDSAQDLAREREAAQNVLREREAAQDLAREREPAQEIGGEREPVPARERAGAIAARDNGAGGGLVAGVLGDPGAGVGVAAAVTAPRVVPANPLSASAGAIAAALVQSMPAGQTADGTAVLPAPAEPSPSPVAEVDDAAKTLAAPLRLDPETTAVDDAAATLTAPLAPSPSPSPPAAAATPEAVPAAAKLAVAAKLAAASVPVVGEETASAELAPPAVAAAAMQAVRAEPGSPLSRGARPMMASDATAAGVDTVDVSRPRSRAGLWIGLLVGAGVIGALLYAFTGGEPRGGVPASGGTATARPPTTGESPSTASLRPPPSTPPVTTTEAAPPRATAAAGPSSGAAQAPSPAVSAVASVPASAVANAPVSAGSAPGSAGNASPTPQVTPGTPSTKPPGTSTKTGKPGMKGDLRGL